MDLQAVIASASSKFSPARDFVRAFPNAEHWIVEAKRQLPSGEWGLVHEWVSRAALFGRYAFWLVVAIQVDGAGNVSAIEEQNVYVVEVDEVTGDTAWKFSFGQLDLDDWNQIVASEDEFPAVEFELNRDSPVDGFDRYWDHTSPGRHVLSNDGIALKGPLRFMSR